MKNSACGGNWCLARGGGGAGSTPRGPLVTRRSPRELSIGARSESGTLRAARRTYSDPDYGAMCDLVLNREQTIQLIQAYGARRHLWDAGDPRYFSRKLRDRAWREIASQLRLKASIPNLKKKLVSLLGSYRREKSRVKQSIMAGFGPEDAYKSKWYGYEHFHFMSEKSFAGASIQPHQRLQRTAHIVNERQDIHNDIKVEIEECDDYVANEQDADFDDEPEPPAEPPSPTPESPPPSQSHAKRRRHQQQRRRRHPDTNSSDDDPLTKCLEIETNIPQTSSSPHHRDHYDTFGFYVSSELRKYDDVTLAHVKHAISNVLFDADLGKYHREPPTEAVFNQAAGSSSSLCPNDNITENNKTS